MKNVFEHGEPENMYKIESPRACIVMPHLPQKLGKLLDIAYNIWWIWNSDAVELFRRMDRDLWEEVYHNPIKMLGSISEQRLLELESDPSFIAHLEEVYQQLQKYLSVQSWFQKEFSRNNPDCKIVYFSMEYGLLECIAMYAGGLGILAGDHFKSASDMGLPMVGIGLDYRYGYFKQHLTDDGWQQEEYVENHFFRMPMKKTTDETGQPVKFYIELPKNSPVAEKDKKDIFEKVYVEVWEIKIGRNTLYLLNTDLPDNSSENRSITYQLYGGDVEHRLKQEILLGFGGVKLLEILKIEPTVWHMNEGHSAFVVFERIRNLMRSHKLSFEEAKEFVATNSIFTTHTPVPAGIDVFHPDLITKYFSPYCKEVGITVEQFLSLGRENPDDKNSYFSMAVLALKNSFFANAVSKLHGVVSRRMWKNLYPELPQNEIPIGHITNGIHTNTWISYEFATLFDRYIGPAWKDEPENQDVWARIKDIPDAELWRSHERRRERLVAFARKRLKEQLIRRGAAKTEIEHAEEVLDPESLTIGFARRFAEYKRGTLLFRNLERLKKLILDKERPIQIIIAGKAHPYDNIGKEIIKSIIQLTKDPQIRRRVVFIEDYDMNVAHYMVQGCDVWLNLPRRPLEASGTSGMKAAVNGVLNVSVLDGWWCEAYNGENGWAVGGGEEYTDLFLQDEIESRIVYDLLEKEIVPLFYNRSNDGLPRGWIKKMKNSMLTICPIFNTHRLIEDYTRKFYIEADKNYHNYKNNNWELTKNYTSWVNRIYLSWDKIKVISTKDNIKDVLHLKEKIEVEAKIFLDKVSSSDVAVQLYWGYLDSKNRITDPKIVEMQVIDEQNGVYKGEIISDRVGHCGYTVRILPKFNGKIVYKPRLIKWQ